MLRERSRVMSNDGVESINSVKALSKSTGLFRRPTSNLPTYDTEFRNGVGSILVEGNR